MKLIPSDAMPFTLHASFKLVISLEESVGARAGSEKQKGTFFYSDVCSTGCRVGGRARVAEYYCLMKESPILGPARGRPQTNTNEQNVPFCPENDYHKESKEGSENMGLENAA